MKETAAAVPPPLSAPSSASPPRRWWRYVKRRRIVCPVGHHFNNSWSPLETGLIQCKHYVAAEHRECGLWIFAFVIRGGGCIIAEVSQAETRHLEELTSPAELIDYLGIFDEISPQHGTPISGPPAGSPGGHYRGR